MFIIKINYCKYKWAPWGNYYVRLFHTPNDMISLVKDAIENYKHVNDKEEVIPEPSPSEEGIVYRLAPEEIMEKCQFGRLVKEN